MFISRYLKLLKYLIYLADARSFGGQISGSYCDHPSRCASDTTAEMDLGILINII